MENERASAGPEYPSGICRERTRHNEFINGGAALEVRIDADQRFGPKAPARVNGFNLRAKILSPNLRERAGKALVVIHESAI